MDYTKVVQCVAFCSDGFVYSFGICGVLYIGCATWHCYCISMSVFSCARFALNIAANWMATGFENAVVRYRLLK